MPKPNILYINSHDTGRYVQPYGHAVPTPTIQKLAEEGLFFRQAFSAAPTCSPSRASLLTGSYPHVNGMLGLAHRGFGLKDNAQHLQHTLQDAGYFTAQAGVQHVIARGRIKEIGYSAVLGGHDVGSEAATEFLDNAPKQPFYLEVGINQTHRPYPRHDPDISPDYCLPPPIIPDTPETRTDMARFKSSAQILDGKIKSVLDALKRNGLEENTLVICTTDHGIAFPQMKCNLTDHGIGVMLMMRGPGAFRGGRVIDSMVSQIDIFPTICDLLGIPIPKWVQGVSLMPLVNGQTHGVRDELFAEVTYHAAYEPMRCVRTERYKYILRFDDRKTTVMPNCDEGESRYLWLAHGWDKRPVEHEQLYDLMFDPMERDNIAAAESSATVLKDMRERLHKYMTETDDPLLRGPVAAPKGAKINDPSGLSPDDPVITVQ